MFTRDDKKYIWQWVIIPLVIGLLFMFAIGVFSNRCEYRVEKTDNILGTQQWKNCGNGWVPYYPDH